METIDDGRDLDRRVMSNIRFHARRLARGRAVHGMDAADYEQDLVLDLVHRRRSFDPARASFATFADRVVGHRASTLSTPSRVLEEREFIPLDVPGIDDDGSRTRTGTLISVLADDALPVDHIVAARMDIGRFLKRLPPQLLECCAVLLADSVVEGARAAGIHRSTVYSRAVTLREEALAFGLGVYRRRYSDTSAPPSVCGDESAVARIGAAREPTLMSYAVGRYRPRLLHTETELRTWLAEARAGEVLEYHRGVLAMDRITLGSRLPPQECEELERIARAALAIAEAGRGHLLQRRHGNGDYSYLLVARARPVMLSARSAKAEEDVP